MLPGYNALAWLLPGTVLFAIVGALVSRRLARSLDTRPVVAWLLVVSIGIVVSATLAPLRGTFDIDSPSARACDLARTGLAPLQRLLSMNDTSRNVLLFIPLGISLGLLPRSRRTAGLIAVAAVLPLAIELAQLSLPILGRSCESGDVIDNLTGLVLGLVAGTLTTWLLPALRRPAR